MAAAIADVCKAGQMLMSDHSKKCLSFLFKACKRILYVVNLPLTE